MSHLCVFDAIIDLYNKMVQQTMNQTRNLNPKLVMKNLISHMHRLEQKRHDLLEKIKTYDDELYSPFPHNQAQFTSRAGFSFANCEGSRTLLEYGSLQRFLNEYIRLHPEDFSRSGANSYEFTVPVSLTLHQVATDMHKTVALLEAVEPVISSALPAAFMDRIHRSTHRNFKEYLEFMRANESPIGMDKIAYHHWHALVRLRKQIEYLTTHRDKALHAVQENEKLLDRVRQEFALTWAEEGRREKGAAVTKKMEDEKLAHTKLRAACGQPILSTAGQILMSLKNPYLIQLRVARRAAHFHIAEFVRASDVIVAKLIRAQTGRDLQSDAGDDGWYYGYIDSRHFNAEFERVWEVKFVGIEDNVRFSQNDATMDLFPATVWEYHRFIEELRTRDKDLPHLAEDQ